jgi:NADPH:quinone reductase-like Zn-dependent oxidoreductase
MIAARIHCFGPPDSIALEAVDVPAPSEQEVLIQVAAAGVGPWDAWTRAGTSALPQPLPLTLGSDVCGIVVDTGASVTGFARGDSVFGVTNARFTGGYAQYTAAAGGMIAITPRSLSDIEAASVPVVAVTAWQMLFDHAKISAAQTVFVHGGAGNVGSYAVQLARRANARVVASAHDEDAAYVRGLGAEAVVGLGRANTPDLMGYADAVIDTVGGDTQAGLFALAKPGGIVVSAVSPPDEQLARRHGVRALFFLVEVSTARLMRLAQFFDAGELRTSVGTVLPLSQVVVAHEMLEGMRPRGRGKIVLRMIAHPSEQHGSGSP